MKIAMDARLREPRADLFAGWWRIEPGALRDYDALGAFHYRAGRPATAAGVWRVVFEPPRGVADVHRLFDDVVDAARVIGVAVLSLPTLRCRQRDAALDGRYRAIRDARQRARMLNDELRCISRVVVHPQFRGLGLAVKLVRHALSQAPTPLVEALAAMGRVHPFFEKAGMRAYPRPPHAYDARLMDALATVGIDRATLMHADEAWRLIARLSKARRRWIEHELGRWRRHADPGGAGDGHDSVAHLRAARQRLFCEPVYYLYARTAGNAEARSTVKTTVETTDEHG